MFDNIKKNFGFGCMRLKMDGDKVNYDEFNKMIDAFMDAGFNYFDTAHGYIDGKSEIAIGKCLAPRYPRESYVLTNKLSVWYIKSSDEIDTFIENQLKACGVDYFDFYLVHAVNKENYVQYKQLGCFEAQVRFKNEGKIKHIGMSFHDSAEILDMILTEQPQIEVVQLQINYLDYDDEGVQSKACYDVAVKHGKKVIVMEPVKGGVLVNLPKQAEEVLSGLNGGSFASYAIRYAASYPEVFMVLSGMGNMDMMNDNISYMRDFKPLNEDELKATDKVREILRSIPQIPCTKCRYCTEVCPSGIDIPFVFEKYNKVLASKRIFTMVKNDIFGGEKTPKDCIKCGKCEKVCPQSIAIRERLLEICDR